MTQNLVVGNRIKWGLGIVAALVLAPVVWYLAYAILGLAAMGGALLLAGAVGIIGVNVAPVFAMKMANWKMFALKAEAAKNPIETLHNQVVEKDQQLRALADSITLFDSEVENYRSTLEQTSKTHPESAERGQPILREMERKLAYQRYRFKQAQTEVANFKSMVRSAEADYNVALAAQRVTRASGSLDSDAMASILEKVAFDSVQNSVNVALAELRSAVMVEDVPADFDVKGITNQQDERVPMFIEGKKVSQ